MQTVIIAIQSFLQMATLLFAVSTCSALDIELITMCAYIFYIIPNILLSDPVVFQKFYNEQSKNIKEIWQLETSQPNIRCKL